MSFKPSAFAVEFGRMFKIPYDNWIWIVYVFGRELHQSYSEVCSMPFFEIEMILEKFKEDIEKENKRSEQQNKEYSQQMADNRSAMSSLQNTMNKGFEMPKMPNIPMPTMPKF